MGQKDKNNGVLIVVAKAEGRVRFEVGAQILLRDEAGCRVAGERLGGQLDEALGVGMHGKAGCQSYLT